MDDCSLDLVRQLQVTRQNLLDWINHPDFDRLLSGFLVRATIAKGTYGVCKIEDVQIGKNVYTVKGIETNRMIVLSRPFQSCRVTKAFKIVFISNDIISEDEFAMWKLSVVACRMLLPTKFDLKRCNDQRSLLESGERYQDTTLVSARGTKSELSEVEILKAKLAAAEERARQAEAAAAAAVAGGSGDKTVDQGSELQAAIEEEDTGVSSKQKIDEQKDERNKKKEERRKKIEELKKRKKEEEKRRKDLKKKKEKERKKKDVSAKSKSETKKGKDVTDVRAGSNEDLKANSGTPASPSPGREDVELSESQVVEPGPITEAENVPEIAPETAKEEANKDLVAPVPLPALNLGSMASSKSASATEEEEDEERDDEEDDDSFDEEGTDSEDDGDTKWAAVVREKIESARTESGTAATKADGPRLPTSQSLTTPKKSTTPEPTPSPKTKPSSGHRKSSSSASLTSSTDESPGRKTPKSTRKSSKASKLDNPSKKGAKEESLGKLVAQKSEGGIIQIDVQALRDTTPPTRRRSGSIMDDVENTLENSRVKEGGEVVDIRFPLSRTMIPRMMPCPAALTWEKSKMADIERQAKQHAKEKSDFIKEDAQVRTKVNKMNASSRSAQKKQHQAEKKDQEMNLQLERNRLDAQQAKDRKGLQEEMKQQSRLSLKHLEDQLKKNEKFRKQEYNDELAKIKKDKAQTNTEGKSAKQKLDKLHEYKRKHENQRARLKLTQENEKNAFNKKHELEKEHASQLQKMQREAMIAQLQLNATQSTQKRWLLGEQQKATHEMMIDQLAKRQDMENRQEKELQSLFQNLLVEQQVQENEQVALKYQKEFQQAEEQHRLRVKKAAKELPTVLKALKRDLEGSSKDALKEARELKAAQQQEQLAAQEAEAVENIRSMQKEEESALRQRHMEQTNSWQDESEARTEILRKYHEEEKALLDGKILAEREQLHKESTIEKGKHQDAEKVMKESFAQQQEVAMWNIQQKHWDAQEEAAKQKVKEEEELVEMLKEELMKCEFVSDEDKFELLGEEGKRLKAEQEAEKRRLDIERRQEEERVKQEIEKEKQEVLKCEVKINDQDAIRQAYIRKIANDTGLDPDLVAKQIDVIGIPKDTYWMS